MPKPYTDIYTAATDQFIRVPMPLIKSHQYRHISAEAKLLYSLLLDRMSLSEWTRMRDKEGQIFIYYSQQNMAQDLGFSTKKVRRLLAELKEAGLIRCVRQYQCRPDRIYVNTMDERRDAAIVLRDMYGQRAITVYTNTDTPVRPK